MRSEESPTVPVGAALVVGGGIGGMQAALDLANGGIKVYLAERGPAIGGVMAQLDKTWNAMSLPSEVARASVSR